MTERGRPFVPTSVRSQVLAEMAKHPGGAMPLDVAAWLDLPATPVRKAMHSLVETKHLHTVPEQMQGGGGKPPLRYFHRDFPVPRALRPLPVFKPQPAAPIVRFSDLGPGRYPATGPTWVDRYLGGAR